MDVMREAQRAMKSRSYAVLAAVDIMVRIPPTEGETGGQVLGSKVVTIINEATNQNAAVKRI